MTLTSLMSLTISVPAIVVNGVVVVVAGALLEVVSTTATATLK
jgi:hypothetical protein